MAKSGRTGLRGTSQKMFDSDYIAGMYFKFPSDRTPAAFMPMPMQVSGSNSSPTLGSRLPGFDVRSGSMHSVNLMHNLGTDTNGNLRRSSVADGMNPVVSYTVQNSHSTLATDGEFENRTRLSNISGRFVTPFPAEVAGGTSMAESIGGAGSTLVYSDNNGSLGNALAMRIHMFLMLNWNDFNNLFSDTQDQQIGNRSARYYSRFLQGLSEYLHDMVCGTPI